MSLVKGRLLGLGVGPGDPELITLKSLRLLQAAPVVGYFVAKSKANQGQGGNAFGIIEAHLSDARVRMPLVYPVTTEKLAAPLSDQRATRRSGCHRYDSKHVLSMGANLSGRH